MNKTFLLSHSGNLRMELLNSFFNSIGINDLQKKIYDNELMKFFYTTVLGIEEMEYDIKVSRNSLDLSKYLDVLVEQRNNVAHGWVEDNRISVYDIINYVIPYIKILGQVLLRILLCESLSYIKQDMSLPKFHPTPLNVFNHNILCMHIEGQHISIGDYILYKHESKIKCAKIENIEIEKTSLTQISEKVCDIGLKIDSRIKKTDQICFFISNNM